MAWPRPLVSRMSTCRSELKRGGQNVAACEAVVAVAFGLTTSTARMNEMLSSAFALSSGDMPHARADPARAQQPPLRAIRSRREPPLRRPRVQALGLVAAGAVPDRPCARARRAPPRRLPRCSARSSRRGRAGDRWHGREPCCGRNGTGALAAARTGDHLPAYRRDDGPGRALVRRGAARRRSRWARSCCWVWPGCSVPAEE